MEGCDRLVWTTTFTGAIKIIRHILPVSHPIVMHYDDKFIEAFRNQTAGDISEFARLYEAGLETQAGRNFAGAAQAEIEGQRSIGELPSVAASAIGTGEIERMEVEHVRIVKRLQQEEGKEAVKRSRLLTRREAAETDKTERIAKAEAEKTERIAKVHADKEDELAKIHLEEARRLARAKTDIEIRTLELQAQPPIISAGPQPQPQPSYALVTATAAPVVPAAPAAPAVVAQDPVPPPPPAVEVDLEINGRVLRICDLCRQLGYAAGTEEFMELGVKVKHAYIRRHGRNPPVRTLTGYSRPTAVYTERDRKLMEDVVHDFFGEAE